jgi:hypothetical protein
VIERAFVEGALSGIAIAAALGMLLSTSVRALRRTRIRCAWCGAAHVSASGQACAACLNAVEREGRAAPDDWPEA